jgi:hypothetical protein
VPPVIVAHLFLWLCDVAASSTAHSAPAASASGSQTARVRINPRASIESAAAVGAGSLQRSDSVADAGVDAAEMIDLLVKCLFPFSFRGMWRLKTPLLPVQCLLKWL